ncbi:glycerophosphodiester phosphodiesterase [Streptomyces gobiensis]|uniref:glycerophosphodiester phosphodiesterase n=1 Tax=Streptomyces gobiensis TaxID=2875706 RepID=UPI001E2DC526|nr:glycerophosphodiester phosphodiesterase family protein [Streptomyces gobiensis]UGY94696.1 glycerophosphodiester phosphodiesterase [Streptomyces gobiensis]
MSLLTVGHRGVMGVEPENTLRSFRRAELEGMDAIELDLHLSKDGELVVMHDAEVDRTTDGTGLISDRTLAELRELDAGQGERIPVFEEVVDAVTAPIQAEIKDRAAARALAEVIKRRDLHQRVTVISFHDEVLRQTRQLLPKMPLVLVTGTSTPTAPERAQALGAYMVSCELCQLDSDTVERCHAAGIQVISWTVNSAADLARARELGLDGVITDMPAIREAVSRAA